MLVTNFQRQPCMRFCFLACLVFTGHGQRADNSALNSHKPQTAPSGQLRPVRALANLLLAYEDPVAFNPSSSGARRVFYTLAELEPDKENTLKGRTDAELRQQQLLLSVQSLRYYDKEIPVDIITFGMPLPGEFVEQLTELGAEVIHAGGYKDAIESILPGSGPFLEAYPVLSKFLALPYMAGIPAQQLLYLDSDTVFLGPPSKLFDECTDADFYAREEAQSERSHEKTNIFQCDDNLCRHVQQGLNIQKPLLPFNTGVILYNNLSWLRLLPLLEFFLTMLLSFCNFLVHNYPVEKFPDKQLQYCKDHRDGLAKLAPSNIPYPALNLWTREQFAALVTFGIGNFQQRDFEYEQVLQGTEELIFPNPPRPVVSHYWSPETHEFCKSVAPRFYPELNVDSLFKASQAQEDDPECGTAAKGVSSSQMPQVQQAQESIEDTRREKLEAQEMESESGWVAPFISSEEVPEASQASQAQGIESESGWVAAGISSPAPERREDVRIVTLEGRVRVVFINLNRRPHRRQHCEQLLDKLGLANVSERFEALDGQELFDNGLLREKCEDAVTEAAFTGAYSCLESGFVLGGHFTPGGVALCASTQRLLQEHSSQASALPYALPLLVLEDDVQLAPGARETAVRDLLDYLFPSPNITVDAAAARVHSLEWDVLLLGSHYKKELEEVASLPTGLGGSLRRVLDFAGLFGYVVRDGAAASRILSQVFPCSQQLDNSYSKGIDNGGLTILHLGTPLLTSPESMPGETDIQRLTLEAFTQMKEEKLINEGHISPAGIDGVDDPKLREVIIQKITEAWQTQFGR